ncbi:Helix-turn-helix domain-containing protein [Paenibacillus sophorae]|uniref:Helix-turn-helix domain-containing protein n=1 Tax=Paenibacillus sophorae TaxID=1333845 RepID=A0A1H8RV78_9BACL|nr:helix-turn-helix transcriptional regulator [Paenibacillus sophorae]QWU16969.1 helix-turn-helix transcriptional regulator [Paenibacillus sophorae]SEO70058.1 Helix-turn-helix domain-containing protein [Paenibacillus sophorae]
MIDMDLARNKQLGDFLKIRRARLHPEKVGLPLGRRRRTAGLRREEVALLAGVSVDWYTWLEQGRDIRVSSRVLEELARVLQLSPSERRHLFLLAEQTIPLDNKKEQCYVSPSVQQFLDYQNPSPAYVTNLRWDFIAWNRAACAVFGDYNEMSELERNSVWRTFTSSYTRELLDCWEEHGQRRLAQFRASYGRFIDDPWWSEMIDKLSKESEEFREWWPRHDVLDTPEGRKVLHHPRAGELILGHLSFQVSDSPDLLVTVHMPETEETLEKLRSLMLD